MKTRLAGLDVNKAVTEEKFELGEVGDEEGSLTLKTGELEAPTIKEVETNEALKAPEKPAPKKSTKKAPAKKTGGK